MLYKYTCFRNTRFFEVVFGKSNVCFVRKSCDKFSNRYKTDIKIDLTLNYLSFITNNYIYFFQNLIPFLPELHIYIYIPVSFSGLRRTLRDCSCFRLHRPAQTFGYYKN